MPRPPKKKPPPATTSSPTSNAVDNPPSRNERYTFSRSPAPEPMPPGTLLRGLSEYALTGYESKDPSEQSASPASPRKDTVTSTVTQSSPLSNKPDLRPPSRFTPNVQNLRRLSWPGNSKKPKMVGDVWTVEEIVAEHTDKNGTLHYLVDWTKSWARATDSFITPSVVREWERKQETGQVSPTWQSQHYAFPGKEDIKHRMLPVTHIEKKKGKIATMMTRSSKVRPLPESSDEMEDSGSDEDLDDDNPSKETSQDLKEDAKEENISSSPSPRTRPAKKRRLGNVKTARSTVLSSSLSSENDFDSDIKRDKPEGNKEKKQSGPVLIGANEYYGASSPSKDLKRKMKRKKKK
ncbi:hypothetical protein V8F20_012368 [Naviculisporaceae sp. PSN 640]